MAGQTECMSASWSESEVPGAAWPAVVAHADWGCDPRKRQVAVAVLRPAGAGPGSPGPASYEVVSLAAAPDGGAGLLGALAVRSGPGHALLGFDFTIGLPRGYAAAAGIRSFPAFLDSVGSGPWREFDQVAERQDEISLGRPFYPRRPGGTSRADLYAGLGLSAAQLRRRADGTDAETLFWTLGARQAGKASLHGWRLLRTARAAGAGIALWPFDGPLGVLLAGPERVVVAEAYPREYYRRIGAPRGRGWSKRRRDDRRACGPALLQWAGSLGVGWQAGLRRRVAEGFSAGQVGEDEFDCTVGVLGMIGVVTGAIPAGVPADDPAVGTIEGWILGRAG
jgi:hypothetical protein